MNIKLTFAQRFQALFTGKVNVKISFRVKELQALIDKGREDFIKQFPLSNLHNDIRIMRRVNKMEPPPPPPTEETSYRNYP